MSKSKEAPSLGDKLKNLVGAGGPKEDEKQDDQSGAPEDTPKENEDAGDSQPPASDNDAPEEDEGDKDTNARDVVEEAGIRANRRVVQPANLIQRMEVCVHEAWKGVNLDGEDFLQRLEKFLGIRK